MPTPFDQELHVQLPIPKTVLNKIHANCCFRAEAQRRRVNTISKRHLPLKMLFYCKKLRGSAPLREITVPTPLPSSYMFNCLSLKMSVPFRTIQKIHTNCCFRAEPQRRRVNTISKRHLPLKMLFHRKKLCASAPLREITVPTPVDRTTPSTT